mgnify:CR=1 FL=1
MPSWKMNTDYEMLTDETGLLYFIKVNNIDGDQYYNGYIFNLPDVIPVTISYRRFREMQLLTDVYGYDYVLRLITDINRGLPYGDNWISMADSIDNEL